MLLSSVSMWVSRALIYGQSIPGHALEVQIALKIGGMLVGDVNKGLNDSSTCRMFLLNCDNNPMYDQSLWSFLCGTSMKHMGISMFSDKTVLDCTSLGTWLAKSRDGELYQAMAMEITLGSSWFPMELSESCSLSTSAHFQWGRSSASAQAHRHEVWGQL